MLDLRWRSIALTAFFGALIVLGASVTFENPIATFYVQIDTLAFIAGVWLAQLAGAVPAPDPRTGFGRLMLGLAFVNFSGMSLLYHQIRENPWTQVWLVAICVIVIWALLSVRRTPSGLLGRFMWAAGDASYSIYLFHMFAVGAVSYVAVKLAPPILLVPMLAASAIAGITTGFVAYRYVEQPLSRLFHKPRPGARGHRDENALSLPAPRG